MSFLNFSRPEYVTCGERARLIPVVADTSKEGRVTSAFLAGFRCVPEYAEDLLGELGFRLGKTSKVECFTEVVLKGATDVKCRPDGLIVITTGKKEWRALIEAKVGNATLDKDQVEMYLDLAKQFGIDAVITISNQFTATPSHHPVPVNRVKCRNVQLYHWSWHYLMAEAVMWVKHHGISDPEQCYILEELVRYLDHPASGILSIERMNTQWKDVCAAVQNGAPLNKGSEEVRETVATWYQFTRCLSLKFSLAVGRTVTLSLKRSHIENADLRLQEDCQLLAQEKRLEAMFDIPDTVSTLSLVADLQRRTVSAAMRIKAPSDRPTAKGRIGWLLRQLDKTTDEGMLIRTSWLGRTSDTVATLGSIRKLGPEALIPDTHKTATPSSFEIVLIKDLAGRFRGAQTFVQDAEPLTAEFYRQVGQYLREWVASPPKLTTPKENEIVPESLEMDIQLEETPLPLPQEESIILESLIDPCVKTQVG